MITNIVSILFIILKWARPYHLIIIQLIVNQQKVIGQLHQEKMVTEQVKPHTLTALPELRTVNWLEDKQILIGLPEEVAVTGIYEKQTFTWLEDERTLPGEETADGMYKEQTWIEDKKFMAGLPEEPTLTWLEDDQTFTRLPEEEAINGMYEKQTSFGLEDEKFMAGLPEKESVSRIYEELTLTGLEKEQNLNRLLEKETVTKLLKEQTFTVSSEREFVTEQTQLSVARFPEKQNINDLFQQQMIGNMEEQITTPTSLEQRLNELHEDLFLDTNPLVYDYDMEYAKARNSQGQYSPDCSFLQDIMNKSLSRGYIEIVISPIAQYNSNGELGQAVRLIYRVNWKKGDQLALYACCPNRTLVWHTEVNPAVLFFDTNIFYNNETEYSAEYMRRSGKVIVRSDYHRFKSCWMWCIRENLRTRPLSKLLLPGTHDSGAYASITSFTSPLRYFTKLYYNYVFTQEDSVFSQLMQGARTLDLRVSNYLNVTYNFFVNHNFFKLHPLKQVLEQIVQFCRIHPYELIILDFHSFPRGFTSRKDHDELAKFLKNELGPLIYTRCSEGASWKVTLDEIWQNGSSVIVAYNDYSASLRHGFFPGLNHIWAAKDQLGELEDYMDRHLPRVCGTTNTWMCCAMMEMTPRGLGIVTNKYNGLRQMASVTNPLVTDRFIQGRWGIAVQAAAVDFIASTGIVSAAVLQNVARTRPNHPCH